jgi:DNA-3-methyladenine glycosylase
VTGAGVPAATPPGPARLPDGARPLERAFLARDALEVAPGLLGAVVAGTDGRWGRIVEVEAYRGVDDPGSHAYRGPTARNATMWGPAGHLYVYFIYGMHFCANVVCGDEGVAMAVLIRAVVPEGGVEAMRVARGAGTRGKRTLADRDLCRGPARFAQAFGLGRGADGIDVVEGPSPLLLGTDGVPLPGPVRRGPRVGLSAGADLPWRYAVGGHPGVSAPRLAG